MSHSVEDIDHIVRAVKHAGDQTPEWRDVDKKYTRLKLPLWIDDSLYMGLSIVANANINTQIQNGSMLLMLDEAPICRFKYFANQSHTNPPKTSPAHLRGLLLPANKHHWHRWEHNRNWPREASDKLSTAEICESEFKNYQEAVNHFCATLKIAVEIPPPPWRPTLGAL